jgi:outer membrane protein OmpA-like peptidoglycan-associated protein
MRLLKISSWILMMCLPLAQANVLGPTETFQPSPDDTAFLTLHSSYRMRKNQVNAGLYFSYMRDTLSVFSVIPNYRYISYHDDAVQGDFVAAWQFARQFQFQMAVSANLWQEADADQVVDGVIKDLQVTDGVLTWRPGIKYSFRKDPSDVSAAVVASVDFPTSSSDPYLGFRTDPIYNLEGVIDWVRNGWGYGINVGYRHRNTVARPLGAFALPIPSQYIASAGMVIGVKEKLRYHLELISSVAASQDNYPSLANASSVEALGGVGWYLANGLNIKAGGTVEILDEGLAPAFRLFAGLNYKFGGEAPRQNTNSAPLAPRPLEPLTEPLSVSPKKVVLRAGETKAITIQGGEEPITTFIDGALGTYDITSGVYASPDIPGKTIMHVKDRRGNSAHVPITILPPKEEAAAPLTADPAELSLLTGGAQMVAIQGGTSPYTYRLEPAFGEFEESTLTYQAPAKPGSTTLIVGDQKSQELRIPIVVRAPEVAKKTFQIANLNFYVGTAKLTPDSEKRLRENLQQLNGVRIRHLLVIGHTDSTGDESYNLKLSRLRAQTVREVLEKELKLEKSQVDAIGYGESSPIATNASPAGRAQNRRVELRVFEVE